MARAETETVKFIRARATLKRSSILVFLFASYLFCYGDLLKSLVLLWWKDDFYSHGFLIPFISLYLVWVKRDLILQEAPVPNYRGGIPLTVLGLLMLYVGQVGGVILLGYLSIVVSLTGTVLLLFGIRCLKTVLLPIAYLLFMIPIWGIFTDTLQLPFQLFSARLGILFLSLLSVPAYLQGIYIELPNITLEVVEACSGVNFLIAIIAIGIPMGHLFLQGWRLMVCLLCFAVGVAILSNGLRVALIGFIAYHNIGGDLHGPLIGSVHLLEGLAVAFVGYAALFAGVWALSKVPRKDKIPQTPQTPEGSPQRGERMRIGTWMAIERGRGVLILGTLFLLFGLLPFSHVAPIELEQNLISFPIEIANWKGEDIPSDFPIFKKMGVDSELSRSYRKEFGRAVSLYVGYYAFQTDKKEMVGYEIDAFFQNAQEMHFVLESGKTIEINYVVDRTGKKIMLFWYNVGERVVTSQYWVKVYTTWNALVKRRSNGAAIIVSSDIGKPTDIPMALSESQRFISAVLPVLQTYLHRENRQ